MSCLDYTDTVISPACLISHSESVGSKQSVHNMCNFSHNTPPGRYYTSLTSSLSLDCYNIYICTRSAFVIILLDSLSVHRQSYTGHSVQAGA